MQTQLSADTCSRKIGATCGIPSGRCKTRDLHKQRLLSEITEDRERAGEQVEGGGDCGELFRAEFLGVVGFNRCVAAFTRAREAQFHKHP